MMTSPVFIKIRLCSGGLKENLQIAHVDVMQIAMLAEIEHLANTPDGPKSFPALTLFILGGQSVKVWDEDRSGVAELNRMKGQVYQEAINPRIALPGQVAGVRG